VCPARSVGHGGRASAVAASTVAVVERGGSRASKPCLTCVAPDGGWCNDEPPLVNASVSQSPKDSLGLAALVDRAAEVRSSRQSSKQLGPSHSAYIFNTE